MSHVGGGVLVTGANGFVGSALCRALQARGQRVTGAVRKDAGPGQVNVGDLGSATDWQAALRECTVVIHLAARVHVMADAAGDPLTAYRLVNVAATMQLAEQAHQQGVRRFVFVSSVKVNGESTSGRPYSAADTALPVDPYGQSKMEAELALREFGLSTGMEVVIVRPPLVYGPGVKANFASLLRLVKLGVPLPLGRVKNARSMVAVENLADLLCVCAFHPAAADGIFMVSDGVDLSTGELVAMIGKAMGKRVWLVPVPVALMHAAAWLLGKSGVAARLFGSLQVDIAATRAVLGWSPAVGAQLAIERTVAHFLDIERTRTL